MTAPGSEPVHLVAEVEGVTIKAMCGEVAKLATPHAQLADCPGCWAAVYAPERHSYQPAPRPAVEAR